MLHYSYLLVGGGMAADAAARAIRARDADGSIGLIGREPHPPYDRPPLSKELWKGGSVGSIWRGTAELGVELHLGRRAEALDPLARRVTDDQGRVFRYDKLLLATGGSPRVLERSTDEVIYFRTYDDYRRLRARLDERGGRFVVIGGGLIGPEIAAALRLQQCDVIMLFPEPAIGAHTLPPTLARELTAHYRARGVKVWPGEMATSVVSQDGHLVVTTRTGRTIRADAVVAGLGIRPNVRLARAAGLPVRNGIEVDEVLRAGDPHVFAAGDVASYYSPTLRRRLRTEHEDAANTMGWNAGLGMAGEPTPYRHLPYFYSDLFDISMEAVGVLEPASVRIVEDWTVPWREGVCYYLRDGVVRGVLLWNRRGQVRKARRLIEEGRTFSPEGLRGLLTA